MSCSRMPVYAAGCFFMPVRCRIMLNICGFMPGRCCLLFPVLPLPARFSGMPCVLTAFLLSPCFLSQARLVFFNISLQRLQDEIYKL